MLTSTLITYASGILIAGARMPGRKKLWVALSFSSNLLILTFFKYFNFLSGSLQSLFSMASVSVSIPTLDILLPVGISFYTFQALSYTMDVYRGDLKPTRHLGKYALFVSFFPQLVAGPIERSSNLLAQFDEEHVFDYERAKDGFVLILFGMFKKIMIADRLSILVNTVYNDCTSYNGPAYILATIFFAFQIYCDFSGYSDIAIGSAEIMGFRLMKNFDRPYFSQSIGEFWRRWHISLSTWFRDYLYIPLGGSRCSAARWAFNIMVVFLVSGLWHGANWTFVIWGCLHGIYQVIGKALRPAKNRLYQAIGLNTGGKLYAAGSAVCTFILVDFAWIFFRANSVQDAFGIILGLFRFEGGWTFGTLGMQKPDLLFSLFVIAGLVLLEMLQKYFGSRAWIQKRSLPVRWGIYLLFLFSMILFGKYGSLTESSFIYFQF